MTYLLFKNLLRAKECHIPLFILTNFNQKLDNEIAFLLKQLKTALITTPLPKWM